jgi:hypothetical protein
VAEAKRQKIRTINPTRISPVPSWNGMVSLSGHVDGDKRAEWPGGGGVPKRYLRQAQMKPVKASISSRARSVTAQGKDRTKGKIEQTEVENKELNSDSDFESPEPTSNDSVGSAVETSSESSSTGKRRGSTQTKTVSKRQKTQKAPTPQHPKGQQQEKTELELLSDTNQPIPTAKLGEVPTLRVSISHSRLEKSYQQQKPDSENDKSDSESKHKGKIGKVRLLQSTDTGKNLQQSSNIGKKNKEGDVSGSREKEKGNNGNETARKRRKRNNDSDSSDVQIYEDPYEDVNYQCDLGERKDTIIVKIKKSELARREIRKFERESPPDSSTHKGVREVQVKVENEDEVRICKTAVYDVSGDQQLLPEEPWPRLTEIESNKVGLAKVSVQKGLEKCLKEGKAVEEKRGKCESVLESLKESLQQIENAASNVKESFRNVEQLVEVEAAQKKKISTDIECIKDIALNTESALEFKEIQVRHCAIQCDLAETGRCDERQKAFDDGVIATELRLKRACSDGAAYQLGFKAGQEASGAKGRGDVFSGPQQSSSLSVQSQPMSTFSQDIQKQLDAFKLEIFRTVHHPSLNTPQPLLSPSNLYPYCNTNIPPVGIQPQGQWNPASMQPFPNAPPSMQYPHPSDLLQFTNNPAQYGHQAPPHSQQLQLNDPSRVDQWQVNPASYHHIPSPNNSQSSESCVSSAGFISPGYEGSGGTWGQVTASGSHSGGLIQTAHHQGSHDGSSQNMASSRSGGGQIHTADHQVSQAAGSEGGQYTASSRSGGGQIHTADHQGSKAAGSEGGQYTASSRSGGGDDLLDAEFGTETQEQLDKSLDAIAKVMLLLLLFMHSGAKRRDNLSDVSVKFSDGKFSAFFSLSFPFFPI